MLLNDPLIDINPEALHLPKVLVVITDRLMYPGRSLEYHNELAAGSLCEQKLKSRGTRA